MTDMTGDGYLDLVVGKVRWRKGDERLCMCANVRSRCIYEGGSIEIK